MMQNNSDEGSTTITNERCGVLRDSSDEGSIIIANERHDALQMNLMKESHQSCKILTR